MQEALPPPPGVQFEWGCLPVNGLPRAKTSATKHYTLNRGGGEPEARCRRGMRSTRRTARRASGAAAAASRASCGRVTIARNTAGSQPAKMAGTTASDNLPLGPARPRNSLGQTPPRHSFGSAFSPKTQESILEVGVGGLLGCGFGPAVIPRRPSKEGQ